MILVMDNAPYHHIRADGYIEPLQLKRDGLFNELILTANITELTVQRGGVSKNMNLRSCRHTKQGTNEERTVQSRALRKQLLSF